MTGSNIDIDIVPLCPAWARLLPDIEKVAHGAAQLALAWGLRESGITAANKFELSIVLADDREQRRLNRDWRGSDKSTNVLAFAAWAAGASAPDDAPLLLGDVVLAFETVQREAQVQNKPVADHCAHLVVHGVLHLLGYDHGTEMDAAAMETLETAILAELGVADPYQDTI